MAQLTTPDTGVPVDRQASEEPGHPQRGWRDSPTVAAFESSLSFILAVAAVVCWHASLASIHPYQVGAAGLVTQLGVLWWTGAFLAGFSVVVELRRDHPRFGAMCVSLFALALVLHGTLPATEPVPRFSTAY